MKPVRFRAPAMREYCHSCWWYANQRPGLDDEFTACIEAVLEQIQRCPTAGAMVTATVRRVLVRRFPYGLYYRNHRDHIEIIGCRHQRRRLPAR